MRTLRDWKPGDNAFNNDHHQQAVLALRELDGQAAYGVPPRDYVFYEAWPAKVVAAGPAAEADWTDERYWVQKLYLRGTTLPTDNLILGEDKGQALAGAADTIVTAVNLSEIAAGTHTIPTDGSFIVWVSSYQDYGSPSFKRYVFTHAGTTSSSAVLLKINTHEGTGGQYGVKVYDVGTYGPDGAGNLTLPEGVTDSGTLGLALNQDENGQSTHWIPTGTYVWGFLLPGISTEAIPKPVYSIIRGQYEYATQAEPDATDLDPTDSATLTDFNAQDFDTWLKNPDGSEAFTGAVSFVVCTGMFDNTGIDGKVYFKFRPVGADADGRLSFVGNAFVTSITP